MLFNRVLFLTLIVGTWTYTIPDATVNIIQPRGFRLSIPHEDGITEVSFNVKIDQRIGLYQPGDFAASIKELTDDRWAFDNVNTRIQPGSTIFYWVHVQFGMLAKNYREIGSVVVTSDSPVISATCPGGSSNAAKPAEGNCPANACELSATTVHGKSVCKGKLIFEDNFGSLDWEKWNLDVRMPLVADDGHFVTFDSRSINCRVQNDQLHITPSLLAELEGDISMIRSGKLDLGAKCTGIVDRSQECVRRAQFYQILPPVVSARINTRNSFSFRFGKVEIRAKLPKGDWLFPLMLLEPLENFYGMSNYASGQVRIAFNRGNEVLTDGGRQDISSSWLYGGVIMTNDEKTRDSLMPGVSTGMDLSRDFHNYTLTWTPDRFILSFDGRDYGNVNQKFTELQKRYHGNTNLNHKMSPFDREFYLTLGVAAGGHSDFPEDCVNGRERKPKPWTNGDPKAELNFWKDHGNWEKTWGRDTRGLHVDQVRVYAL